MKVRFFAANPKYYFHPLDPESDCDISGKVMAVSANKEIYERILWRLAITWEK
jgi:hypothetical protein